MRCSASAAACCCLVWMTFFVPSLQAADDAGMNRGEARKLVGQAVELARQGRPEKAIDAYSRAIELDDRSVEALFGRAALYAAKGRNDLAIGDYSRIVDMDRRNANAFNNRGMTYFSVGRYPRAVEDLTSAVNLDQAKPLYRQNRAAVYARMKEYGKAIADYTAVVGSQPENGDAYAGRGAAYFESGDVRSARFDLEKACSLGSRTGCQSLKAVKRSRQGERERS